METKGIETLTEQLSQFEYDVMESITKELKRINRTVLVSEWSYVPFNETVQPYIDTIRLDEDGTPTCDVSFSDIDEKDLSSFFFDNEIHHRDMITLLEFLQATPDDSLTETGKTEL